MFGAISKLFKKSEPISASTRPTDSKSLARANAPLLDPLPHHGANSKATLNRAAGVGGSSPDCLTVPYSSIIKLIPQELWGKLAPAGLAGYNYSISRGNVLEQLPHGSVKVAFGELRRGAPSGVFINTPAEDARLVDLPLAEILSQLHPDAFARRPGQARVQISADVPDLFGTKGERLAPLRVMEKKEVSNTSTFARQNVSTTAALKNTGPLPQSTHLPSTASPVAASLQAPASAAIKFPGMSAVPAVTKPFSAPSLSPKPLATVATSTAPRSLPKPISASVAPPIPSKSPALAASASEFTAAPAQLLSTASFLLGLDAVAENWPDGVRQELAQLKIPDAKVALPPVEVCEALKRGRIQYPWRTLRSWIQPTPNYATPSPHDDTMLELPLGAVTPLFLDFIRAHPINRQAADAENITEFFRKAEQASGTSPDLLQPLFDAPTRTLEPKSPAETFPRTAPSAPSGLRSNAPASPSPVQSAPPVFKQPSEISIENGLLCLPLALIATGWPEPVLRDISQFGLQPSHVEFPLSNIESALKLGRIEFTWGEICSWLNPPSKPAQLSINSEHRLPLSLDLIAPLFLKNRAGATRKKTVVSDNIPDLFSAVGKPLPPPPLADQGASNPVLSPSPSAPRLESTATATPSPNFGSLKPEGSLTPVKAPMNLSELFGEPNKKTWTPNEIVQRTVQLPNVTGALIALQDGLLVASNMPQTMNTETIAAFVPQIFGRLNQYSKELQLGETKAVSFTVEAGTVQVYNAGIIYFAALGRIGTLLPFTELQLIAGELSRHTK
jgi:predicted regulator of Ras-like GTPase activity (Roadblock/LC7/MglB family)